jgi:hypothetical protein
MFQSESRRIVATLGLLASMMTAGSAAAGTLENLERERALLVELMLDPSLDAEQRAQRINKTQHQLVDLERMVIRDRSLHGNGAPIVRKAFENYDLTFLVHASIENERSLKDQWLDEVGVSTETLMAARRRKR